MKIHSFSRLLRPKLPQIRLGLFLVFLLLFNALFKLPPINQLLSKLDAFIYDQIVSLNLHTPPYDIPIVIVDIDEESVHHEGRWPWPRDKIARLLLKIKEAGIVVTAVDIVMGETETNPATHLKETLEEFPPKWLEKYPNFPNLLGQLAPQLDNDQILASVLHEQDVVLGVLLHNIERIRTGSLPPPLLDPQGHPLRPDQFKGFHFPGYNGALQVLMQAARWGGFVTNFPDPDGVIRHGLLLGAHENKLYPSLALATVMRYQLTEHIRLLTRGKSLYGLDLDGTFIPTNANGQLLIPYWGPPFTMPYYSATDVLSGKADLSEFSGGIAIIGSSMIMLADIHASPVATLFPGAEMVANMVAAILQQQLITQYYWFSWQGLSALILLSVGLAVLFPFLSIVLMLSTTILFALIIIGGTILLFGTYQSYIAPALPLSLVSTLAALNYAYGFLLEKRQKNKIQQLFGQYVPETYVKELIELSDNVSMEGQTRHMTVLFSDIRQFTNISEGMAAMDVKRLLNQYFTPITEIIFKNQGTIDKYVGDMVMAFWGAPIPIPNRGHATQAIRAALYMIQALPEINNALQKDGLPAVSIGIGLASGLMHVGDMGSAFRRSYTVLGDVVNLASRLESLTKFYCVPILVNDEARVEQSDFLWREVDRVAVKGRKQGVTIYEPLGFAQEAAHTQQETLDNYHQALNAYYAQDWEQAEHWFKILREQDPSTYLYQMYFERTQAFKKTPPPPKWTGVYVHLQK